MSEQDNPKSVPVADVMNASKAMLQKQLYAIFTTPVDGLGPVFANIEKPPRIPDRSREGRDHVCRRSDVDRRRTELGR